MADPFVTALAVLMTGAGAVSVTYLPVAGGSYPVQALRDRHSETAHHTFGATMRDGDSLTIRVADIPEPATGDTITITTNGVTETLRVLAAPALDVEGLSWIIQAAPDPY